jgi:hypothetical protein
LLSGDKKARSGATYQETRAEDPLQIRRQNRENLHLMEQKTNISTNSALPL